MGISDSDNPVEIQRSISSDIFGGGVLTYEDEDTVDECGVNGDTLGVAKLIIVSSLIV